MTEAADTHGSEGRARAVSGAAMSRRDFTPGWSQTTFLLPTNTLDWVESHARETGQTPARVLRKAIQELFITVKLERAERP